MRTPYTVVVALALSSSLACSEKSGDKPAATASSEPASATAQPADAKPADAPPADAQPADAKPADGQAADEKPADASPAAAEAMNMFKTRCATCHGAEGKGDGPAAAGLNPKPRDYRDPAWQKSVTDDHLKKVIVEGGMAVGKSALMPPNPDLKDKPEVVGELVKIIRGYGAQ